MQEKTFYSEHNTDKIIREKYFPEYSYKGIMVEVGAAHPEQMSLSKHFRDTGWRCICVEPNLDFCKMHSALGNEIYNYACSNENTTKTFYINEVFPFFNSSLGNRLNLDVKCNKEVNVEVIRLNHLLERLQINFIDLLCIDVEGWELEVLEGFDAQKYKPKIIVLENYLKNPKYQQYMKDIEYKLKDKTAYNEIYIYENVLTILRTIHT